MHKPLRHGSIHILRRDHRGPRIHTLLHRFPLEVIDEHLYSQFSHAKRVLHDQSLNLLVPQPLREAAYGLGIPRWRTTLSITLRTATSGVITGIMLAFARVAGETAPLLFTTLGNQFWNLKVNEPTAALPLHIYPYANSPYDDWHRQAWAGAFVLIVLIVTAVAAVRFAVRRGTFGAS